jgi:hypothetical protein
MPQPRNPIIHNVHIYLYSGFWYIPTVVKRQNGFWVEIPPAEKIEKANNLDLTHAIQKAQKGSGQVFDQKQGWDGDSGKIWDFADSIIYVYWFSDGTIKIAPQMKGANVIDPETGKVHQGDLRSIKEKEQLFPQGTPLETIVAKLIGAI